MVLLGVPDRGNHMKFEWIRQRSEVAADFQRMEAWVNVTQRDSCVDLPHLVQVICPRFLEAMSEKIRNKGSADRCSNNVIGRVEAVMIVSYHAFRAISVRLPMALLVSLSRWWKLPSFQHIIRPVDV